MLIYLIFIWKSLKGNSKEWAGDSGSRGSEANRQRTEIRQPSHSIPLRGCHIYLPSPNKDGLFFFLIILSSHYLLSWFSHEKIIWGIDERLRKGKSKEKGRVEKGRGFGRVETPLPFRPSKEGDCHAENEPPERISHLFNWPILQKHDNDIRLEEVFVRLLFVVRPEQNVLAGPTWRWGWTASSPFSRLFKGGHTGRGPVGGHTTERPSRISNWCSSVRG